MEHQPRVFLRARWAWLAMLHYPVPPSLLEPHLPPGTEPDLWEGRAFASLVGFLFQRTRVLGVPVPFHRDFEEINLRFYVRRRHGEGWRSGVAFIREFVPRAAIAAAARWLFGERYAAVPTAHRLELDSGGVAGAEYRWRAHGRWHRLAARAAGKPFLPAPGSEESFLVDHRWGYSRAADGACLEYEVEHAPWAVRAAAGACFDGDGEALYGPGWGPVLAAPPSLALLVEGSPVRVRWGRRLNP